MESRMQDHYDAMNAQLDQIWDEARADVKNQFGNENYVSHNPYDEGTAYHAEYEDAFEHYVMTVLGY